MAAQTIEIVELLQEDNPMINKLKDVFRSMTVANLLCLICLEENELYKNVYIDFLNRYEQKGCDAG